MGDGLRDSRAVGVTGVVVDHLGRFWRLELDPAPRASSYVGQRQAPETDTNGVRHDHGAEAARAALGVRLRLLRSRNRHRAGFHGDACGLWLRLWLRDECRLYLWLPGRWLHVRLCNALTLSARARLVLVPSLRGA